MPPSRNQGSFGPGLTRLTRDALLALLALYIAQLLAQTWLKLPVLETLALWPFRSGHFRPWQPITAFLVNDPSPVRALLDGLVLFFLLPPVERSLGRVGVARALAVALGMALVFGLGMSAVGAVAGADPFLGISPVLAALLVLFGLANPSATILLFFVLPIRAVWLVWGSGLLALLMFLATRDLTAALWVGAWLGAWLHGRDSVRRLWLRLRYKRTQSRLRRLHVVEGGRSSRSRDDPKGPLYH